MKAHGALNPLPKIMKKNTFELMVSIFRISASNTTYVGNNKKEKKKCWQNCRP